MKSVVLVACNCDSERYMCLGVQSSLLCTYVECRLIVYTRQFEGQEKESEDEAENDIKTIP